MSTARPEWMYQGERAPRVLSREQRAYAITLRRITANHFQREAARRAVGNLTPEGREWTGISDACRREVRRMDVALTRLAREQGRSE